MPSNIIEYIEVIEYGELDNSKPKVEYKVINDSLVRVLLSWELEDSIKQDDWQLNIIPEFEPNFHWTPHLTPIDDHIIAQHVFRAPALLVSSNERQLSIVPDIDLLEENYPVEWYMDLDAQENQLTLGLSNSKVEEHVLYTRDSGAVYPPGEFRFGFYILTQEKLKGIFNSWRDLNAFFWERWGKPLYEQGEPLPQDDLEPYVEHTYNWAFNHWKDNV